MAGGGNLDIISPTLGVQPERGFKDSQGNLVEGFLPPTGAAGQALTDFINPQTGQRVTVPSGGYTPPPGFVLASNAPKVSPAGSFDATTGQFSPDPSQYVTTPYVPPPRFLPSEPITPGAPDPKASSIDATIRPFLTEGLRQAQELFLRQQPSMYPGQTYIPPSEQTLTALQQQENIARQASPFLGAAQGAYLQSLGGLSNTAAGQFLNANPYQQQMMQAATRPLQQAFSEQVLPGISSLYSKSGRLGSGSMERALGTVSDSLVVL